MHSNFVTPPDIVETVLIVDATDDQLAALTERVKTAGQPYNVYFYHTDSEYRDWFDRVALRADVIIYADKNDPLEYFNK